MTPKTFHLLLPDTITCGAVFSSPHSGREYPVGFLRRSELDSVTIRSSEDAYVDQLFDSGTQHGAPVLAASAPRAYVDLNRGAGELDPSVIKGVARVINNPRVASGLGVIPRVVAEGRSIMQGKMELSEAQARLEQYYFPYHAQLRELLDTSRAAFGEVVLIDCHSMPRDALRNVSGMFGRMPEIVLGDRFGSSCSATYMDHVESLLIKAGFRVARNSPFAGAYITQTYGRPSSGQHCIQIEIDRSLYLNEDLVTKNDQFEDVRRQLAGVVQEICEMTRWPMRLAAE